LSPLTSSGPLPLHTCNGSAALPRLAPPPRGAWHPSSAAHLAYCRHLRRSAPTHPHPPKGHEHLPPFGRGPPPNLPAPHAARCRALGAPSARSRPYLPYLRTPHTHTRSAPAARARMAYTLRRAHTQSLRTKKPQVPLLLPAQLGTNGDTLSCPDCFRRGACRISATARSLPHANRTIPPRSPTRSRPACSPRSQPPQTWGLLSSLQVGAGGAGTAGPQALSTRLPCPPHSRPFTLRPQPTPPCSCSCRFRGSRPPCAPSCHRCCTCLGTRTSCFRSPCRHRLRLGRVPGRLSR
jgi:hypothetical protein